MKRAAASHPIVIFVLCLATVSACQHANAAVMVYTEQTAWESAVAGVFMHESFDGVTAIDPIPQGIVTAVGSGLSVYYTRIEQLTDEEKDDPKILLNVGGDGKLQLRWDPEGTLTTTSLQLMFEQPIRAFAANFQTVDDGNGLTLTINGATTDIDAVLGSDENGFVGWVADAGFTSAEFGDSGGDPITVFKLNDAFVSQVPEPSTIAGLAALGVGGLIAGVRRRVRKSANR